MLQQDLHAQSAVKGGVRSPCAGVERVKARRRIRTVSYHVIN